MDFFYQVQGFLLLFTVTDNWLFGLTNLYLRICLGFKSHRRPYEGEIFFIKFVVLLIKIYLKLSKGDAWLRSKLQ